MWLLPSSACARAAVNQETAQGVKIGHRTVKVNKGGRTSPPCRSLRSRLRKGALRPAPLPLKREDETFDELFERLAQSERPINIGAWSREKADRARGAVERSRESFER